MTDILQLAREAGAQVDTFSSSGKVFIDFTPDQLSAFRDAVLEEAAVRADGMASSDTDWDTSYWNQCCERIAAAIRAMKGQP